MSRGPGRVQRGIEDLFQNNPTATFATENVVAHVYPGRNRVEKSHRVAVLRAAEPVATRMWWGLKGAPVVGNVMVFYNLCDITSYATGLLRTWFLTAHKTPDNIRRLLTDPTDRNSVVHRIAPGGDWWLHVQIRQALRDGRRADAEALQTELKECDRKRNSGTERRLKELGAALAGR
jgi:hypothetical protein